MKDKTNKLPLSEKIWNFCAKPFRKFEKKHPEFYNKHRDLIGSMVCGVIGSIITYLFCSFMPYLFGQKMAEIEFLLPDVDMQFYDISYDWSIIGFSIRWRDGEAIIGGGLGYSISFYLANITTHLVSFLFLRRFHHSHQSSWKQYLIGLGFCLGTCVIGNMINGLWLPIVNAQLTFLEYNLIVLFVVGTINFIVGHFQNLLLYKDNSKLNKMLDEMENKKHEKEEELHEKEIEKQESKEENSEKEIENEEAKDVESNSIISEENNTEKLD